MGNLLELSIAFIGKCAELFEIPVPGLGGITFFNMLTGLFLTKASIVAVKIIFGIDHGKDEA